MLYEKYRPKMFRDVIGQGENSNILRSQVLSNKIAHSYLLKGERGSGKTTTARILAKVINCEHPINGEPCCQCASCKAIEEGSAMDVVEIDAASNNGVEQVRAIIDDMRYAPSLMKYKVYIIDEAHMLSKSASNAFLKTLEEPPSYGVFILCTTEETALPITILSRCQRFNFRSIDVSDIYSRIEFIANNEGYNPPNRDKILSLIAKMADGAIRDAICVLEQAIAGNISSDEEIAKLLGIVPNELLFSLLNAIKDNNSKVAIDLIYNSLESGIDSCRFITNLVSLIRYIMLIKANASLDMVKLSENDINIARDIAPKFSNEELFNIIEILNRCYSDVKNSKFKGVIIEMAIIKIINGNKKNTTNLVETSDINIDELKHHLELEIRPQVEFEIRSQLENQLRTKIESELRSKIHAEVDALYLNKLKDVIPKIEQKVRGEIQNNFAQHTKHIYDENMEKAQNIEFNKHVQSGKIALVRYCREQGQVNSVFSELAEAFDKAGFIKQRNSDFIKVCSADNPKKVIETAFQNNSFKKVAQAFFIINGVEYELQL